MTDRDVCGECGHWRMEHAFPDAPCRFHGAVGCCIEECECDGFVALRALGVDVPDA